jgi:hypothetical protein
VAYACPACGTGVTGEFATCRYCGLEEEHRQTLETFLRCRGVLRDMEREMSLSYPTVRARVDQMLAALGFAPPAPPAEADPGREARRRDILAQVESGRLAPDEAVRLLQSL